MVIIVPSKIRILCFCNLRGFLQCLSDGRAEHHSDTISCKRTIGVPLIHRVLHELLYPVSLVAHGFSPPFSTHTPVDRTPDHHRPLNTISTIPMVSWLSTHLPNTAPLI